MTRVRMICAECGSAEVVRDAWAAWDDDRQDWVLQSVHDYAHCDECGGEARIRVEVIAELGAILAE